MPELFQTYFFYLSSFNPLPGDGHIEIGSNSNKTRGPILGSFYHPRKNHLALLKLLKNSIGSGFVKEEGGNAMRYVIADKQGVIQLTLMMNGYFRTGKGEVT
jgi:hypothetical protein